MKYNVAYVVVEEDNVQWIVALCERNVHGYRPVQEYGPYKDEDRAKGVVERLNNRLGVPKVAAHNIIRSTMPLLTPRKRRAPVLKPRRKHSGYSSVRCDICSPLRCSKAK